MLRSRCIVYSLLCIENGVIDIKQLSSNSLPTATISTLPIKRHYRAPAILFYKIEKFHDTRFRWLGTFARAAPPTPRAAREYSPRPKYACA